MSSSSSSSRPPVASSSASKGAAAGVKPLRAQRRRLSVVSDNKLIEGVATLGALDNEDVLSHAGESVVRCYAGVTKKGYAPYNPRKRNQDALLMEEHRATSSLLFGVFDGHGEAGDLVSHFFSERLPGRLPLHPRWSADPAGAITDEIDRLERTLLADPSVDTEFSGTTAVVGTVRKRTLTVANIGDSRCIIGRSTAPVTAAARPARRASLGGGAGSAATGASPGGRGASTTTGAGLLAVEVTSDHKPDRPDEEKRIVERGGRVFAVEYEDGVDGPPRVWLGHMDIPGLAMSRSLGDSVAHSAGVISAAEVSVVELAPEDKILVWASDGLWEFMSNQEVIDMISGLDDPRQAVEVLIAEANARWMKEEQVIDDTTVIVAFLDVPPLHGGQ